MADLPQLSCLSRRRPRPRTPRARPLVAWPRTARGGPPSRQWYLCGKRRSRRPRTVDSAARTSRGQRIRGHLAGRGIEHHCEYRDALAKVTIVTDEEGFPVRTGARATPDADAGRVFGHAVSHRKTLGVQAAQAWREGRGRLELFAACAGRRALAPPAPLGAVTRERQAPLGTARGRGSGRGAQAGQRQEQHARAKLHQKQNQHGDNARPQHTTHARAKSTCNSKSATARNEQGRCDRCEACFEAAPHEARFVFAVGVGTVAPGNPTGYLTRRPCQPGPSAR
eukprot:4450107-Prymnesium_polylepis.2